MTTFPLARGLLPVLVATMIPILTTPVATAARSWDDQSSRIVERFPALLPATPSSVGYHEAQCAPSEVPPDAVHALGCRDVDDVVFQVIRFSKPAAVEEFLENRRIGPANRTQIEDGSQVAVRIGECHRAACFVVTFDERDRANYLFLVAQSRAKISGLLNLWWPDADFTGGHGD